MKRLAVVIVASLILAGCTSQKPQALQLDSDQAGAAQNQSQTADTPDKNPVETSKPGKIFGNGELDPDVDSEVFTVPPE